VDDIRKLLDDFDESAQSWGLTQSEGWGDYIREAEERYTTTKKALLEGIEKLEKLTGQAPSVPSPVNIMRRKINW
jgi:hypothetical protein